MLSLLCALALQTAAPAFKDDLDKASLLLAVRRQTEALKTQPAATVRLGSRQVPRSRLLKTLDLFADVVQKHYGTATFVPELNRRFELVKVGPIYVTGYYLPLLEARRQKQPPFIWPLLKDPGKDRHYSRIQIEAGALSKRGLEFAWVKDPIARYSLMVQGSGLLQFEDGRVQNVNFAGSNGFPYTSMGRVFINEGKLTEQTLSWQAIKAYFIAHPNQREGYFNRNQSYCFFRLSEGGPLGLARIPLTAGRSVATDKAQYPAGALGFLSVGHFGISRFVLDQDTGGAIRGPKRLDLFLGGGDAAEELAGRLKHDGELTYLLAK